MKVKADAGMMLTFYNAEQEDIVFYYGFKSVSTTQERLASLREITEAQHDAYNAAKEAAMQTTGGEGGE